MSGITDWLGKTTGLWETSDSKKEREHVSSLRDKYENNNRKLERLVNANTGIEGSRKALAEGMRQANNVAQAASNQANQNARSAGMSKAAAAALGANTGANTFETATQDKQKQVQSDLANQIKGQEDINTEVSKAQESSQKVLENQQAVDEATGNSSKALINAGINAATGGLGGIATTIASKLGNIGNKKASNLTEEALDAPTYVAPGSPYAENEMLVQALR